MSRVLQYAVFPASDAFKNDRGRFKDALEVLSKQEGHAGSWIGLQVEEEGSKQGYLITGWDSAEHHKKFRESSPEKSGELLATLKEAASGEIVQYQISPVEGHSAIPGLNAKTTEFVIVTPKPGQTKEAVFNAGVKVRDALHHDGHFASFGTSTDGSAVFLMVVAWDSAQHHYDTIKDEKFGGPINDFAAVGVFDLTHAHMEKYT